MTLKVKVISSIQLSIRSIKIFSLLYTYRLSIESLSFYFLLSLQAQNPSLCMRTSFVQSATDLPKAQPALRGGSACRAPRWTADTPAMSWLWRWEEETSPRNSSGSCMTILLFTSLGVHVWKVYLNMKRNEALDYLLLWGHITSEYISLLLFPVGELPPLSGQSVPPVPSSCFSAAVSTPIPSCWGAEWTHTAKSTPQLR